MTTYYVRKSGSDGNSGLTEALAKLTIASAITASTTGDTIDIGVGTWAENINSSRVYRGVSMFKTIVSAVTSAWSGLTMTFQNIRVNQASMDYSGNFTYIDAWHDFSSAVAGTYGWFCTSLTMTRSIFTGSAASNPTSRVIRCNATTIDRCVFGNLYAAALFELGANTVSMRNTIWSILDRNSAQPISLSGVAFQTEEYNTFYSALSTFSSLPGGALGTGSKNDVNPLFRDAAGFDFRLADNSPCIGAGHV